MSFALRVVCALCSMFVAFHSQALAQADGSHRQGFWISGGLGGSGFSCASCESPHGSRWSGAGGSGLVALGGTPRRNLLIGGELLTGFQTNNPPTGNSTVGPQLTVLLLAGTARFYPFSRAGLSLAGGAGVGVSSITGGGRLIESPGVGALLGAGYDLKIGRSLALTPWVRLAQMISEATVGDDPFDTVPKNPQLWAMGVALTKF